jgi:hypothetical protein
MQAICKRLHDHCQQRGHPLEASGFQLAYATNIPRQAGLSGSSAIICAGTTKQAAYLHNQPSGAAHKSRVPTLVSDSAVANTCKHWCKTVVLPWHCRGTELSSATNTPLGKPVIIKPVMIKPVTIKPVMIKPVMIKPVAIKPVTIKPVTIKPVMIKPVIIKPVTIKPVTIKPVMIKPVIIKPVMIKPVTIKPVMIKPVMIKPVMIKPVAIKPVTIKPVMMLSSPHRCLGATAGDIGAATSSASVQLLFLAAGAHCCRPQLPVGALPGAAVSAASP